MQKQAEKCACASLTSDVGETSRAEPEAAAASSTVKTATCLLALEVGGEERVVVRVGDDLGLDGIDVAGVGRRRRGLLRLDARVEEAAAVGELQHRVATGAAA